MEQENERLRRRQSDLEIFDSSEDYDYEERGHSMWQDLKVLKKESRRTRGPGGKGARPLDVTAEGGRESHPAQRGGHLRSHEFSNAEADRADLNVPKRQ